MELPWLLVKAGEKDRLIKCLTTASIFWSLNRFIYAFGILLLYASTLFTPQKTLGDGELC